MHICEVGKRFYLVSHLESLQIRWLQWFLTRHLSRHSIDLKGIIIHMHVLLSDTFHFTVSKEQPSFAAKEYKLNDKTNINMNFAYLTIKLAKYCPFLFVLNHLKLDF